MNGIEIHRTLNDPWEEFLGVCLTKACKERKAKRQEFRDAKREDKLERRDLRTDELQDRIERGEAPWWQNTLNQVAGGLLGGGAPPPGPWPAFPNSGQAANGPNTKTILIIIVLAVLAIGGIILLK